MDKEESLYHNFRHLLEWPRKSTKNVIKDSWSPGHPKCKASVLAIIRRYLFIAVLKYVVSVATSVL